MTLLNSIFVYATVLQAALRNKSVSFSYYVKGVKYNAAFAVTTAPTDPNGVVREADALSLAAFATGLSGVLAPVIFKIKNTWYEASSMPA
jgi:hypothetical protein